MQREPCSPADPEGVPGHLRDSGPVEGGVLAPKQMDPLVWCQRENAWVRWSRDDQGHRVVQVAVACGLTGTHLVEVISKTERASRVLLAEAVERLCLEVEAHDRRKALRLV